ncbi:Ig-like domain-containing protein, partial [Gimesia panareensis]
MTVESTGADVVLNSGDDFLLSLGGSVIADTTITINIDPITDGAGATVDLLGNVDATLTTINGGDDSDIFNILPTSDSPINIVGGNPTLPGPGDTLNIDLSGVTNPALVLGATPGSGTFNFIAPDTELPVSFTSIEDVNTSAGAYHLVLDMVNSGFQNAADDTIDVGLDAGGNNLLIDINGGNFFTGDDADILSFTVLGSNDNDTLNINETAGGLPFFATAAPAGIPGSNGAHLNLAAETFLEDEFNPTTYDVNDITIHYDGKNGTDAINVNFLTDHNAGYFSDVLDGLGSGNIAAATTAGTDIDLGLSFANVEEVGLSGSGTGGGLHVDASSTPDTTGLNINDDGTPADGISQITGNGGFTDLLFEDFTDLQVLSGTGAETIDLIALDSATTLTNVELDADDVFAVDDTANDTIRVRSTPAGVLNVNVLGGLGDDLIQVFDAGSTVNNIFAALDVDGEGGNDTLIIVDSGDGTGDTFEVTSTTVDGLSSSAGTDVTYANIDNLNVTGTDGDDTINVNLGLQEDLNNVTINGAGGDDDSNVQNSTPAGVNTVLNGQAGNDEFFFLGSNVLRGFINGGGNVDTIDYSGYTPVVHVELTGLGTTDGFQGTENNGSILGTGIGGTGFDNINDLVGSAGVDTLEGPNLNNYWGVTSTDEGFIIAERNNLAIGRPTLPGDAIATPPEERLDFTSFQNLIGGTQDDRFDLSDGAGLTGSLDGDAGNDSLDYRDYTTGVNVDLFAGTATNIGGGLVAGTGGGDDDNSIENVFGGDGNDNITGDNDNNILGDGLGSDNLDGGGYGVGSENGGNDVFLMEPGAGGSADVITDIHGNDTVDFRFASQGIVFDVDIINTPQDVFGGNTVELRQLQPEQPDTNPSFMENVVGSEFDDYIFIDPLSQDGNYPIDGPPVLRSADGRGGTDTLDFDAKGQAVIDTGYSLTADGVGTVQYLNFENVTPFEDNPATIVDDGDLGFSLEGDWPYHPAGTAATTTGIGYEDDVHTMQSQLVDPVHYGDARAFWEFYGLTPGVYRVSVTWPASDNAFVIPTMATDAPYTVFDGSRNDVGTTAVDLGTFDLNQQLAPDDFQADGALWEDLGTFTINSRTLTVMLTNLADGLITADAVRIERVSAGPEVQLTDVTDVAAPPVVLVDGNPGGIDFGTTELLTDLTRTFEITNTGSAALNISNIVIPTGFTTTLTAQSVGVGATISFDITMDSTAFGDRSGLFSFDTDDVDEA